MPKANEVGLLRQSLWLEGTNNGFCQEVSSNLPNLVNVQLFEFKTGFLHHKSAIWSVIEPERRLKMAIYFYRMAEQ